MKHYVNFSWLQKIEVQVAEVLIYACFFYIWAHMLIWQFERTIPTLPAISTLNGNWEIINENILSNNC